MQKIILAIILILNTNHLISQIVSNPRKEQDCIKKGYEAALEGKYKRALKYYTCALEINPNAFNYGERGKIYSALGNSRKSINDYLISLSLDSTNQSITSLLIKEYRYIKDYENALYFYEKLLETKNEFENLVSAMDIYNGLRKYDLAILSSNIFLDKYNDSSVNSSFMANTYFEIFDYKKAIQHLERNKVNPVYEDDSYYINEFNKKIAISYTRLAIIDFKRNKDTSEFIKYLYKALLSYEPVFLDDEELRQLARLLFSMGKLDYSYRYFLYIKKYNASDYRDLCKIGDKTDIKSKLIKKGCKKMRKRRKRFKG